MKTLVRTGGPGLNSNGSPNQAKSPGKSTANGRSGGRPGHGVGGSPPGGALNAGPPIRRMVLQIPEIGLAAQPRVKAVVDANDRTHAMASDGAGAPTVSVRPPPSFVGMVRGATTKRRETQFLTRVLSGDQSAGRRGLRLVIAEGAEGGRQTLNTPLRPPASSLIHPPNLFVPQMQQS
jgi:hypothetical protein